MDTNKFNHLVINKNRGWRGLAEVIVRSVKYEELLTMTFSFSPKMWIDLIVHNKIVVQDINNYYVITFDKDIFGDLPKPSQQRSVLIKNAVLKINNVNTYVKDDWTSAEAGDWNTILHFVKNKNNHTTSDWNCIGLRVVPKI